LKCFIPAGHFRKEAGVLVFLLGYFISHVMGHAKRFGHHKTFERSFSTLSP